MASAASAVGICGLLTVGYPSIAASGGYGQCGFRLMDVPRCVGLLLEKSMPQPQTVPHGASWVPGADLSLGNSVGAIGTALGALPVRRCRPCSAGCLVHLFHDQPALPLSGGWWPGLFGGSR